MHETESTFVASQLPGPPLSSRPDPDSDQHRLNVLALCGCAVSLLAVVGGIYLHIAAPGEFPSGGDLLAGAGLVFPLAMIVRAILTRGRSTS